MGPWVVFLELLHNRNEVVCGVEDWSETWWRMNGLEWSEFARNGRGGLAEGNVWLYPCREDAREHRNFKRVSCKWQSDSFNGSKCAGVLQNLSTACSGA